MLANCLSSHSYGPWLSSKIYRKLSKTNLKVHIFHFGYYWLNSIEEKKISLENFDNDNKIMMRGHWLKYKSLYLYCLTCKGRWGGAPIPWWYITSCFNCWLIWEWAWLLWCFWMSTAASASALLNKPSFKPENMSPYKNKYIFLKNLKLFLADFKKQQVVNLKLKTCSNINSMILSLIQEYDK